VRRSVIERKLLRVDRALDEAIERSELPGAVVLARMPREGELLEHTSVRGLAVTRPERILMQRDTIFDLASLTKIVATTTAVLLLVEEGRLELDSPVARWLPAFAERGKEGVTLRHLLTHSSGLKPWRAFHEHLLEKERKTGERWLGTPAAREHIFESLCRQSLVHDPGAAAVYGDLDFILLGFLIEEVTQQPLQVFFRERIAVPLQFADIGFLPVGENGAAADRRRIAATENCPWRQRILWGEVHDPNASALGGVAGHAGLFAPASALLRFAEVWLAVWHGRSDLLPQHWVRHFSERQELPAGSDWALGWDTPSALGSSAGKHFSKNSVGHLGFTGTSLWIDLEREAVVVMLTNRVHLLAKKSRFALRPLVHDLILEAFLS